MGDPISLNAIAQALEAQLGVPVIVVTVQPVDGGGRVTQAGGSGVDTAGVVSAAAHLIAQATENMASLPSSPVNLALTRGLLNASAQLGTASRKLAGRLDA